MINEPKTVASPWVYILTEKHTVTGNDDRKTCYLKLSGVSWQCVHAESFSWVRLLVTPWTAAHKTLLFSTTSWSLLKYMSIELVMVFNHFHALPPQSPFTFNLFQGQGLFQWVTSSHQVAKVSELQLQWQFFPWTLVVQSLSRAPLFVSSWTAARQAFLSFTISQSWLKLKSIESMMSSNHLILCHPLFSCLQSFPASESFPVSWLFISGGQNIGASASAPVFPMTIQGWFPLGLTRLISLLSKGFSRVFSIPTVQKHQFFGPQPTLWSNSHIHTWLLEKPLLWLDRPLSTK